MNRLSELLSGELKFRKFDPGALPGVVDVGITERNFCEIVLIWPEGIRLNGTGLAGCPGKWI